MKPITIVMPFCNEKNHPLETVKSIYATADPNFFEIIAIDDASDFSPDFSKFKEVRVIKNKERLGSGASKHLGAYMSHTPYIFIIDAHIFFKGDWLHKVIDCLQREPNTAWCFTCAAITEKNMDINKPQGKYYGANLLLIDNKADYNRPSREIFEPKWALKKSGLVEWEIPVILGANYAFTTERFKYIRGMKGLRAWGSEEPFVCCKFYMSGGKSKINTEIETFHLFRDNAPYVTQIFWLYYNKIYICKTIFPEDLGNKLIDCLPKNINLEKAMLQIEKDKDLIEEDREYYKSIFVKNIYDYCREYNIELPD